MVLPDYLPNDLRAVFCGTAVSSASAAAGHYYAGPGNEFWQLLHRAGLTPRQLRPDDDADLLTFGLGLTDIVKRRAASSDSSLSREDYDVDGFVERVAAASPRWVAFNGKTSAKAVAQSMGRSSVNLGVQPWTIKGAASFVLPSTSAANRRRDYEGRPDRLAWFEEFASMLE